ncbi:MAG: hypothetical protein AB1726_09165 [Planctomycetota bacterium]
MPGATLGRVMTIAALVLGLFPALLPDDSAVVREKVRLARGLVGRFGWVDLAEEILDGAAARGLQPALAAEVALSRAEVRHAAAEEARETVRRAELYEGAIAVCREVLGGELPPALRSVALARGLALSRDYARELAWILAEGDPDPPAARRREDVLAWGLECAEARLGPRASRRLPEVPDREHPTSLLLEAEVLRRPCGGCRGEREAPRRGPTSRRGPGLRHRFQFQRSDAAIRGIWPARLRPPLRCTSSEGCRANPRRRCALRRTQPHSAKCPEWLHRTTSFPEYLLLGRCELARGEFGEARSYLEFVLDRMLPRNPADRAALDWTSIPAEFKQRRWEIALDGIEDLLTALLAQGDRQAAAGWALQVFTTWKRDHLVLSRRAERPLYAVARTLARVGGFAGRVVGEADLAWFPTADAMLAAGFRGKNDGRPADELARSIARQLGETSGDDLLVHRAKALQ